MRTSRTLLALVATVAVLLPMTAAQAATTSTHHGIFTGVTWTDCTTTAGQAVHPSEDATGTWGFAEHRTTGTVSINIFLAGKHHVSFGGTLPLVTTAADWAVQVSTGAGLLTVSQTGDELAYQIGDATPESDYASLDGTFTCDYVVYHGTAR